MMSQKYTECFSPLCDGARNVYNSVIGAVDGFRFVVNDFICDKETEPFRFFMAEP